MLLALGPASETVIAVVNRLISESVPPRRLPRLALAGGIPREHRVLVVIPAIITDAASVHALARNLERHYLANRERHAQFALLTDFADAASADCDGDAALLADATAAIDALESRYPPAPDAPRRFLLLHRQRSWSETEQQWIGWERKRGKLEQLIDLLAGATQHRVHRPRRAIATRGANGVRADARQRHRTATRRRCAIWWASPRIR